MKLLYTPVFSWVSRVWNGSFSHIEHSPDSNVYQRRWNRYTWGEREEQQKNRIKHEQKKNEQNKNKKQNTERHCNKHRYIHTATVGPGRSYVIVCDRALRAAHVIIVVCEMMLNKNTKTEKCLLLLKTSLSSHKHFGCFVCYLALSISFRRIASSFHRHTVLVVYSLCHHKICTINSGQNEWADREREHGI